MEPSFEKIGLYSQNISKIEMAKELSYEDFLKEIKSISSSLSISQDNTLGSLLLSKGSKSAKDIHQELCLDFPLITKDELITLKEHLLQKELDIKTIDTKNKKSSESFPILRKSFLDGIIYGTRKHQSKELSGSVEVGQSLKSDQAVDQQISEEENAKLSVLYQEINAIIFVKYIKHMLHLST